MTRLLIIKFGGSVITYKGSLAPKLRKDVINNLGKEISSIIKSGKYKVILVHGAGSFGHPIVKKHNLQNGMKTSVQKLAYSKTMLNMLDLNRSILDTLILNKISPISFPPHAFAFQNNKKFKPYGVDLIKKSLELGLTPVLFGDAVLDNKLGCSILSGDVTVSYLAEKLGADKIIYLSDVDGIFESNPKVNPKAKLIKEVNSDNFKKVMELLSAKKTNNSDVTGEMRGKLISINQALRGKTAYIVNGLKKGIITRVLKNEMLGTKIYFK